MESMPTREKHILSYGGGVNSFALLLLLIRRRKPLDAVVFADTGEELPETYSHLNRVKKHLDRLQIPFIRVKSKNGTLYETCRRRRVIPSQVWRWSTRDYKITPIYSYYRSLNSHVQQYLALAYDEVDRMKDYKLPYVTNLYPLIDEKLNREDCVGIIREAGFPVPKKSGCFFCPFNNVTRWYELYHNHRDLFWRASRLEENSKHFPRQKLTKLTLRVLATQFRAGYTPSEEEAEARPCGSECLT